MKILHSLVLALFLNDSLAIKIQDDIEKYLPPKVDEHDDYVDK